MGERSTATVWELVPGLRRELEPDAVNANCENSAGGRGTAAESGDAPLSVVDFLILGEHAFDQEGMGGFLDEEQRIVRPANAGAGLPGRGCSRRTEHVSGSLRYGAGGSWTLLSSPSKMAGRAVGELKALGADSMFLGVPAEAPSDKQTLGWHLDGRVAAVIGNHIGVPTADLQVLPGGTACTMHVGMTCDTRALL